MRSQYSIYLTGNLRPYTDVRDFTVDERQLKPAFQYLLIFLSVSYIRSGLSVIVGELNQCQSIHQCIVRASIH